MNAIENVVRANNEYQVALKSLANNNLWLMRSGKRIIPFEELTETHLKNIINTMNRALEEERESEERRNYYMTIYSKICNELESRYKDDEECDDEFVEEYETIINELNNIVNGFLAHKLY